MIKIHGDRNCRTCKGLCHGTSYREKHGTRKSYYCGTNCIISHIEKEFKYTPTPIDIILIFEQVNVISK